MENSGEIPVLSTSQMVEVDRLMIEVFRIELVQMMENAGRSLAELARRELGGQVAGRSIACLCGAGNNGGGGLVAARHLHNWGAEVVLVLAYETSRLKEVPAHQLNILTQVGVEAVLKPDLYKADLIIDALIGYGLSGNPRQPVAGLIEKANNSGCPILALDAPSGLDTTTGVPGNPCIKANATLTLALPKIGLMTSKVEDYVGQLYLADISVPRELYQQMGIEVPNLFADDTILRVDLV
jgi:NAD(P)H-hydrate epimerase